MIEVLLVLMLLAAKPLLLVLVFGTPAYFFYRRIAGLPFNWALLAATASLPVSAYVIWKTALPTRYSATLDSNFLAFESGCLAMFAAYGATWAAAWLAVQALRRKEIRPGQWVLALCVIGIGVALLYALLPLAGKPVLPVF